jgi:Zn-dependent membrane protease YugP
MAVAAHECGHAVQDKENYTFLKIRSSLVPVVNFASYGGYFAIMIGAFSGILNLIYVGILLECVILLFQLITLPVEFNASNRALQNLRELRLVNEEDYVGSRAVLRAAAMTYVAALATAVASLLRVFVIAGSNRR